ncbi:uncharacterized [Tachysurus ichikawai]
MDWRMALKKPLELIVSVYSVSSVRSFLHLVQPRAPPLSRKCSQGEQCARGSMAQRGLSPLAFTSFLLYSPQAYNFTLTAPAGGTEMTNESPPKL